MRFAFPVPVVCVPAGDNSRRLQPAVRHGGAAAAAFSASALSAAIPPFALGSPFLLPLAAVIGALWFGRWRAGVTAAVTAALALLLLRVGGLSPSEPGDLIRISGFLVLAAVLCALVREVERAYARLRLSEQLSSTIVDNAPLLMAGADADGRTILFNRACEQVTGLARADVIGAPFLETFVPTQWRDVVAARFQETPPETLAAPHDNPWMTKDGEVTIEWRCFRIHTVDGRPMTLGIGQDVMDRRRLERQTRETLAREAAARAEAESATRTKANFIATLSHELRGPLNVALGWSQLVRQTAPNGLNIKALEAIDRNLRLMSALVDDVIEYTRVEHGKVQLDREPVDMDPWLTEIIAGVRLIAASRSVDVQLDVQSGVPLIEADPRRLAQVVWNVVNNAVKFTPAGGRVTVRAARASESMVGVFVSDTGAGISPDVIDHVFEPFFQAAEQRPVGTRGLGLGLALVRQLVEAHGGTVSIWSDGPQRGTTVRILLPTLSNVAAERPA